MSLSALSLTLAILKPSTVARPKVIEGITRTILSENIYIIRRKQILLNKEKALKFYKEHEGKFFYNRLVTYMSSGPMIVMALAGCDVIQRWRTIMGPTKVYRTQYEQPASIRGLYGISDTRNATHGSDSIQSAKQELQFFFPEFDYNRWYAEEEEKFRNGTEIYFDDYKCIHCLKP